jgi:hypothetical protein
MNWTSVDIGAGKAGVAEWYENDLIRTYVVKPCGNKGAYWKGDNKFDSKYRAWYSVCICSRLVIMERGAGNRPNVINGQAKLRGYLEAICETTIGTHHLEVNVSEWRRVIKEDLGISWPWDSARQKELALKLAKELYQVDVTEDEADAILLGHASIRMGLNKL